MTKRFFFGGVAWWHLHEFLAGGSSRMYAENGTAPAPVGALGLLGFWLAVNRPGFDWAQKRAICGGWQ